MIIAREGFLAIDAYNMKEIPFKRGFLEYLRTFGIAFWIAIFGVIGGELRAQNVEKDSSEWVGEWRDTGNLQYAFNLKLMPLGDGRVTGVFEWKLIWTSLDEHRPKIGAVAKEYVVGRYDPSQKSFNLVGVRQTDPADIISMDHYLINLSADGKRIEGINVKPENYHGSMFGVKVNQKPKQAIAAAKPSAAKNPSTQVHADPKPKTAPLTKPVPPTPVAEVESPSAAKPIPLPSASKEVLTRAVVTKTELRGNESQVKISVYDESIVDGDVISLSWNGIWILRYYRVVKLPKEFVLDLQKGENSLVMYAENLGRYPPNTAAISVHRGAKTQQILLNSDMGKSEAIKFIRE